MTVTIGRRELLAALGGAAAAWPLAAHAQQPDRMWRIGVLTSFASDDPAEQTHVLAFAQALAQSGWIEGRNARIEIRWGAGDPERIRRYAAELVALEPDVILAVSSAATGPLLRATRTVPIVLGAMQALAPSLGVEVRLIKVRDAGEIERA
jgi:putative ABC transport system substrate-binding protein